jgi:shikimate kinase
MSGPRKRTPKPPPDLVFTRSVALVGMMGAGKTTIGRRLAPRLGLRFFDADDEIRKAAGMSVADLFAAHGEASFRRGEAQVIARLLGGPACVLATGGGAILDAGTRALIKERAVSVWIRADVDTLAKRATRRDTRPLLRSGDPKAVLARLIAARERFYAEADLIVDSFPGPHARTIEAILKALAPYAEARAAE